ncbi:MAG: exo-alpha-sialidase [Bryobacteraceae bacterium]|nr:exo-alpha-sialidase [Bryobacteraceae bacterium]
MTVAAGGAVRFSPRSTCGKPAARAAAILLGIALVAEAQPRDAFAPVFVGRPPSDAYIGLTRLPRGELRHYNYGEWAESEAPSYIVSLDNGFTWQRKQLPGGTIAADQRSPISGEYIRLLEREGEGVFVARSRGGIDGRWEMRKVWGRSGGMLKPPVFIRGGKRILVGCQFPREDGGPGLRAGTFYSDDDGFTWSRSNLVVAPPHAPGGVHKSARWQNGACEPAILEWKDGRVWMLMRTSQDNLYESISADGGQTWEAPRPSRFYSTLTMPTLGRLKDGRVLLLWNNTTPLPEVARDESHLFFVGSGVLDATWEDVFTNRDAIHAAISSDEGKTWRGFRELYLNPRRNDRNYAETGGTDRSVHQSQFVELDDGSVLVSLGQHSLHRALVRFHPDWLLEKARSDSFENGLEAWSVHMYVAGIRGHCAFNRRAGADLVEHPDHPGKKALRVRRLRSRRPREPALVSENQGAVWNFPAGTAGALTVRVKFLDGGQGGRISLLDRWVNPTDPVVDLYAMFTVRIGGDGAVRPNERIEPGRWHELTFSWNGLAKTGEDACALSIDGVPSKVRLPLNRSSVNGIGYVHFQSTAEDEDTAGFLVESVGARVK